MGRKLVLLDLISIEWRNISNLSYADDTIPNGRKQEGTKEPVDEGQRSRRNMGKPTADSSLMFGRNQCNTSKQLSFK